MTGVYRIAGYHVKIISLYPDVHKLCAAYRSNQEPDLTILVRPDDIEYEKRGFNAETAGQQFPYSDGYLETLAVYRNLADLLLAEDILLFHGSAIAVDGIGYLFTAKSGTGKSTHTRLWRELLGDRAVMINDDKPLLKITESGAFVYGTPWAGKHRLSSNTAVPLRSICILERGEHNQILPITREEAWPMLLQQSNRPKSSDQLRQTLRLIDRLSRGVSFYRLRCNISLEAAQMAYETMRKGACL